MEAVLAELVAGNVLDQQLDELLDGSVDERGAGVLDRLLDLLRVDRSALFVDKIILQPVLHGLGPVVGVIGVADDSRLPAPVDTKVNDGRPVGE